MRPRRQLDLSVILIALAAVGLVVWMGTAFWNATRVRVELAGLVDGTPFTPDAAKALDIEVTVPDSGDRFRATLTVDGVDVLHDLGGFVGDGARIRPTRLVESGLVEGALDEGPHEIRLSVGRFLLADSVFRWEYAVDSVAPSLKVPATLDPAAIDRPVAVRGTVEAGVDLRLDGDRVKTDGDRFEVRFDHPPTGTLHFEAEDRAGNRTRAESVVPVIYPAASRGVHVTAAAWQDADRRAGILDLVDRKLIDTVELDLKDESGVIAYASKVPEAVRIKAVRPRFDLADAVRTLEGRGVRVIGRVVAFRDPIYAAAAWSAGRRDEVVQTSDGALLDTGGGYANYVNPNVRAYNLDIALEATDLGVRDILWDYVRRPEGAPNTMVVPGLDGPSSGVIAGFLGDAHKALRARGVYQGATVLGISAASGDAVAQDVPAMARAVDYLAPMIYPADWGPGQYRISSPIRQPGAITTSALADFQRVSKGSGVRFLPWLQDFSLKSVSYGPAEVRAQIDAAASLGINGFLLWNPSARYTADALSPVG